MQPSKTGSLPPRFRVADWTVDPSACRLIRGDREVHLRPLLVDLLLYLAGRAGDVVTKDEVLERVWQGRFVSDSVLSRTMTELRHVLGDDFARPRIIETIRKRGYRLIAPVVGLRARAEPRIAVLAFENLNRDPELDYFAAGISDALTTELGNIRSLQVISRQSMLTVTRAERTIAEIARHLNVDAVLEGSALHAGDRVRITAQLIRAEPEHHLWAQTYVCDMRDILQTQGRVARAVAEAVQATLTPNEVARLTRPRSVHPDAHLAYLKARYHSLRWDRDGLEKGFGFALKALQIDPEYAPVYVLLAHAFTVLGYWCHLPVEFAFPQAKEAAAKAIQLDDALGEAHAVSGTMKWLMDWDLDGCEAEMRTALELNPSSELIHGLHALFLAVARRDPEQAIAHARLVLELDPLSMSSNFFVAWLHFFCGDYRKAAEQAHTTLDMYPNCLHAHYVLGWSALAEGRHGDAIAAYLEAAALARDAVSVAYLATAHARAGDREEAQKLLRELTAMRDTGPVPEFLFALVHAGLGDLDTAVDTLERCLSSRDSRLFWFTFEPIGGPLQTYGRFLELMRRVEEAVQEPRALTTAAAEVHRPR